MQIINFLLIIFPTYRLMDCTSSNTNIPFSSKSSEGLHMFKISSHSQQISKGIWFFQVTLSRSPRGSHIHWSDVFTSSCLGGGSMSYLRYLCLFMHSGVQYIVCCVFLFFFSSFCVPYVGSFSGLSIFDCPFGISNVWLVYC